jgi:hypothetical protein
MPLNHANAKLGIWIELLIGRLKIGLPLKFGQESWNDTNIGKNHPRLTYVVQIASGA